MPAFYSVRARLTSARASVAPGAGAQHLHVVFEVYPR